MEHEILHQLQCYVNFETTKLKTNEEIYTDNQKHLVD
jgi:hypothetical protein